MVCAPKTVIHWNGRYADDHAVRGGGFELHGNLREPSDGGSPALAVLDPDFLAGRGRWLAGVDDVRETFLAVVLFLFLFLGVEIRRTARAPRNR